MVCLVACCSVSASMSRWHWGAEGVLQMPSLRNGIRLVTKHSTVLLLLLLLFANRNWCATCICCLLLLSHADRHLV
jgi:hypothetical protein